jgi:hypothetical protein
MVEVNDKKGVKLSLKKSSLKSRNREITIERLGLI